MIAATHFNRVAMSRGLAADAISRGTLPDEEIPQVVRDGLRTTGIDVDDIRPKGLHVADAMAASLIITFDVELPPFATVVTARRWDGMPSVMESFTVAREAIVARVDALVAELERSSP